MPTFEKIGPKPAETRVRPRLFEFRWLGRNILEASRRLGFDLLHRFSSFEFLRAGSLTERIGIKLLDIKKNLLEAFRPLDIKMGGSLDLLELAVMPPLAFKAILLEKIAAALPEALRPTLLDIQVIESPILALNGGSLNYQVLPAEIAVKAGPQFEKNRTLSFAISLPSVAEMPARTLALTFRSPEVKFGTGQLAGVLEETKVAMEVNRQLYHDPSLPVLNREAFEMDLKAAAETGTQPLAVAVGKVRAKEGEGIPQLLVKLGEVVKAKEGEVYALGDGQIAVLLPNANSPEMAETLSAAAIEVSKTYECRELENIFMFNEVKASPEQSKISESVVAQLAAAVQREKPAQGRLAFVPQPATVRSEATLSQAVHYLPDLIKSERSEAQLKHLVEGRETDQVVRLNEHLQSRAGINFIPGHDIAAAEGKAWEYDLQHWQASKKSETAKPDAGREEARSEKVSELVKNIVSHLRQQGIESPLQSTATVRTETKDVPRVVPQEQSNKENQQQEQQRKKKEVKIGQEAMGERELVGDLANILGMAREAVSVEAKEKLFDLIFQRAIDNASLRKVLLEMMDLFFYEQNHRKDSRLGDYFNPEIVAKLFEADPSIGEGLPPAARLILNEVYHRVREGLEPQYQAAHKVGKLNQAALAIKGFGYKSPKKGGSKERYEIALELLIEQGYLSSAQEVSKEKIEECLELIGKEVKRIYSEIEKRADIYSGILTEVLSRYEISEAEFLTVIRRVLIGELMLEEEGSVGGDVKKLKEALLEFHQSVHGFAQSLGIESPRMINILGDGEYLALSELLFSKKPETEAVYVSRKSMMTEMEYYQYLEELKQDPGLVNDGKRLDQGMVYSRLYRREGNKLAGIYVEATQAAKQFRSELEKQPEVEKAGIASRTYQYYLREFTKKVEEERLNDPEFRAATDRIFSTQLQPLVDTGQPLVFIDTGLKGTIPSLLASLVEIKQGESRHHPLDEPGAGGALSAQVFVLSVEEAYAGVIPHLATGRAGAKTIEDIPRIHRAVLPNDIRLSSRPLGILYLMGLAAA